MHHFTDFKGFGDAKLNLFAPITVLIGPNGSGKSNVIEAVELLSFIVHGRPLHDIVDVGRGGGWIGNSGRIAVVSQTRYPFFDLGFSASINFEGKDRPFYYSVTVGGIQQPRIVMESLLIDKIVIFETTGPRRSSASDDIKVSFNNFARGGYKPQVHVSANRSVLSQYKEFASKNKKYNACVRLVNGIMAYLRSSFVFDPNPKLMHTYQRIGTKVLSRDGANLSAVLYALAEGSSEDKMTLERLLGWIRQLPEEPYEDFEFITTPLNDVIFGLKTSNGELLDARLLSDGTLRCLAVLTALETVATNSRVVIEEFDNGLHPSRVHILAEAIHSCCSRRQLNVLVTTHNPATLNGLQQEQLDGVVFCVWDVEKKAFKLVRLLDLPRYDELLEQGRLGDLVTRRVVEKYLAPKFEEQHKQKALTWIKELS